MCGRFVAASSPDDIAQYFGADAVADSLLDADSAPPPSFNVAPTADVLALRVVEGDRTLESFHWGLVPSWAKDPSIGNRMINARSETASTKNAFKSSLVKRRCLIPVDGFYEWTKVPGHKKKQPWFIQRPDGEPYAFAGLFAWWRGSDEREGWLRSCTILTGAANEKMTPIHDRMPIIVPPSAWERWLDPELTDIASIESFFAPAPNELISYQPVSTEVNNARNHGPHLIVPVDSVDPDGTGDGVTAEAALLARDVAR